MKSVLIGPDQGYSFDVPTTAAWLLRQHAAGGPCCVSNLDVLRLVAARDGMTFSRNGTVMNAAQIRAELARGLDPRPMQTGQ